MELVCIVTYPVCELTSEPESAPIEEDAAVGSKKSVGGCYDKVVTLLQTRVGGGRPDRLHRGHRRRQPPSPVAVSSGCHRERLGQHVRGRHYAGGRRGWAG